MHSRLGKEHFLAACFYYLSLLSQFAYVLVTKCILNVSYEILVILFIYGTEKCIGSKVCKAF